MMKIDSGGVIYYVYGFDTYHIHGWLVPWRLHVFGRLKVRAYISPHQRLHLQLDSILHAINPSSVNPSRRQPRVRRWSRRRRGTSHRDPVVDMHRTDATAGAFPSQQRRIPSLRSTTIRRPSVAPECRRDSSRMERGGAACTFAMASPHG